MGGEQFESIVAIAGGVPFAVFAIKGRLDRLIELMSVNNEIALEENRLLDKLVSDVESSLKT
jgi:hypothetical protein